jgi:hypothetical protein
VSFVIDQDDYFKAATGHTGVRIHCGEYDTVFGFYPKKDSILAGLTSDLGWVDGKIQEETSRDDEYRDGVGKRLSKYHADKYRREYYYDIACKDGERLRRRWKALAAKPPQFGLLHNNCTTTAVEQMSGIVPLSSTSIDEFFQGGSVKSPSHLSDVLDKAKTRREDHRPGT